MNHIVRTEKHGFRTKMITLHFVEAIDSTNNRFQNCPRHRIYEIGLTKEKLISVKVTPTNKKNFFSGHPYHEFRRPSMLELLLIIISNK